ncbi:MULTISPECIES: MarR family transcriptional regulator [unclassified Streptomyces]|uniref:LexA family protein n=1 Tax=unclassified Streptomyces TaxID=2593676 RepID=UPI0029AAD4BA|nr:MULTISPECIES: MarR family transcriptional regulator [unclassified Streptomyces]MDX3772089.1 hypothetical protein [Streptomyces sp. AK08-01B]MDX3821614.1 hypothetical protein [Streptomyces sp. AK08-01A]
MLWTVRRSLAAISRFGDRDAIADTGDAPTVREIGRRVGLSSTGSVAYQLGRLEKLGLISRNGRHWRSCRLSG